MIAAGKPLAYKTELQCEPIGLGNKITIKLVRIHVVFAMRFFGRICRVG
jgi:hypothetical protein